MNPKKRIHFFLLFILLGLYCIGQPQISNMQVQAPRFGGNIEITYDLSCETPTHLELFLSTDNGTTYNQRIHSVTGDIDQVTTGQNKTIQWNALEDLGKVKGDQYKIKMIAYEETIERYDIVINGGSLGAVSAAFQAARQNTEAKVLLLEPTNWLGGQATTQGVSAIDNAYRTVVGPLMSANESLYYGNDWLEFQQLIRDNPDEVGEGYGGDWISWVTRFAFDPRTGAWALDHMAAQLNNLTVKKLCVVKDVETVSFIDERGSAKRIVSLKIIQRTPINGYTPFDKFLSQEILDWYSEADSEDYSKEVLQILPSENKDLVVVSASELGDVMVLAGADYTVGREKTTEYFTEAGEMPELNETGTQSFVFPFCAWITPDTDSEEELKTPFPDFETYYTQQENNFFSLGSHTWERVWTYRRLYKAGSATYNTGDVSMQNWFPGNDYVGGTLFKTRAEALLEKDNWQGGVNVDQIATAEKHAIAYYFFYKKNKTITEDIRLLREDDTFNMMNTKTGLAKMPYFRGTRRIIGLENFRVTETFYNNRTDEASFRYYDSLAIGQYPADIHPNYSSNTGITPSISVPEGFYVPYRALASSNIRNLLAAGKNYATTFVTNSAYRLHPIEWAAGVGAGGAAAIMAKYNCDNFAVLEIDKLREMQTEVNNNSPISWDAFDAEPVPSWNGDIIVNKLQDVTAGISFSVEVYHQSYKVKIYNQAGYIGEGSQRVNGRFLFEDITSTDPDTDWIEAVCYDENDQEIDRFKFNFKGINLTPTISLIPNTTIYLYTSFQAKVQFPLAEKVELHAEEGKLAELSDVTSLSFLFEDIELTQGSTWVEARGFNAASEEIGTVRADINTITSYLLINNNNPVYTDIATYISVCQPDTSQVVISADIIGDIGEITVKTNSLFNMEYTFTQDDITWVEAKCYNAADELIDTIRTDITLLNGERKIIVNNGESVPVDTPFEIHIYHPAAVKVTLYAEDTWLLGSTTNTVDDHFVFNRSGGFNTAGERWVNAYCYDENDQQIDHLQSDPFTVYEPAAQAKEKQMMLKKISDEKENLLKIIK